MKTESTSCRFCFFARCLKWEQHFNSSNQTTLNYTYEQPPYLKGFNRYSNPFNLISYMVDSNIPNLPSGNPF